VNGAQVSLLTPEGAQALLPGESSTPTNAEGRFAFTGLPAGDYVVVAESGGAYQTFAPSAASVSARPNGEVALELADGHLVELSPEGARGPFQFRVVDAQGVPLFDDVRRGAARFGSGFHVKLAPGHYIAEVHCPGFITARESFTASPSAKVVMPLQPSSVRR
jgi:hypothetical protein